MTEEKPEDFHRHSEERQSKTKRVKNYLKKCKNALSGNTAGSSAQKSDDNAHDQQNNCAYWYVENEEEERQVTEHLEEIAGASDNEIFEKVGPNYIHQSDVNVSEETLVDSSAIESEEILGDLILNRKEENLTDSLPTLVSEQDVVEGSYIGLDGVDVNVDPEVNLLIF